MQMQEISFVKKETKSKKVYPQPWYKMIKFFALRK